MKFWNEILHTALLGSDKRSVDPASLPEEIAPLAEQIAAEPVDKEDRFLRLAAISFNYRQAGVKPHSQEALTLSPAPAEIHPYCSTTAEQLLSDLLLENNLPLIQFWLTLCRQKGQIVRPDILPQLLQAGTTSKLIRKDLIACSGKRAEWLGSQNPAWAFVAGKGDTREELWQTGSLDQRRLIIQQLRQEDPDTAREWLQQTWPNEDANTKLDLLQQLTTGLSEKDLPFLESLSSEKGKKVKEQANLLLRKIPGSRLVTLYATHIQKILFLKKERTLLGLSKKLVLELRSAETENIDKAVYDSGIEKLSNNKTFTDDEFLAYQLIQWIPVEFFLAEWGLSIEALIQLFQEDPLGKKLFPSLILSVVHFSDKEKAKQLVQHSQVFYIDLIPLLPKEDQDHYAVKFFNESPDSIIVYSMQREHEWPLELTRLILQYAAKNPYKFPVHNFTRVIHLIPVTFVDENFDSITRLLNLKKQTINVFK